MSQSALPKNILPSGPASARDRLRAPASSRSLSAPIGENLLKRALGISMFEGALFAIMLGTTESYLGALAVELGHGPQALALLATVPLLVGAVSQLLAAPLTILLGGRKRLVVIGATAQALSLGGFVAIAIYADTRLWTLLSVKVMYWLAGSVLAPAWSAWMASLTSTIARGRYFAWRSAVCQFSLLIVFVLSGLSLANRSGDLLFTFAGLFAVGLSARLASASALALQPDVPVPTLSELAGTWRRVRDATREANWQVPIYLATLMFGAHIASPFFTPYMLRDLELDYRTFATLSAISILTKALVYPATHRIAAKLGLRTLLGISGLGVALVPLIWAASRSMPNLMLAHVLGGAAWAGLEYTSFQLLLDAPSERVKVEFLSLAGALTGVLQVSGALTGGFLLANDWLSYKEVFALSACLRGAPLTLIVFARPRSFGVGRLRQFYTRLVSVLPAAGASQRPMEFAEHDEDDEDELPGDATNAQHPSKR